MSLMNIDPKIVRDYVNAINRIDNKIKNNFNEDAHEMVRKAKELRNYVFPFFSERNDILNFIDYSSIISNSLIDRMCTDFSKFAADINKALELNYQFLKTETDIYNGLTTSNGLPTFPKEGGVNNIHILRKVMDEAKQKYDSISVGGLDDAKRKQAAWNEYAKARKEYEDEFRRQLKKDTPTNQKTTLTKEAAKKVAQGIWFGTITKDGKLLFGDERKKYLEEKYGKEGAKMVQEELNKMAGTNTTQKPTTTQPRKVTSTSKPTPSKTTAKPASTQVKTTAKPVSTTQKPTTTLPKETFSKKPQPSSTTQKPTTTTTLPKKTFSKAPNPTTTQKPVTTQPAKTTQPQVTKTVAPTPKPTATPKPTVAPTPTVSQDPGGKPADGGVKSKLEEEIRKLREQVEKEQQERIRLEQQIQQQQSQQQQSQPQAQAPSNNPTPTAQVVQPEQPTVAPTPEITIPSGNDGTSPTVKPEGGTDTITPDSPSLPNPDAGDGDASTPNPSSSSGGGFNPVPWGIGLGAAVAGGVGVKAYANHRKNSKFDDENEDSVTNGNRFWTEEDPNVVHSEQDLFNQEDTDQDVSYQAVENSADSNDTWNIEENELSDDNTFDLLSENN